MNFRHIISTLLVGLTQVTPAKAHTPPPRRVQPTYASYREAAAACANQGYEAGDLVEVVFRKTITYRDSMAHRPPEIAASDALLLFALGRAARNNEPLRVLDFGGACGTHYFATRALFLNRLPVQWHVVETSAMARRAMALEDGSLRFFDNIAQARQAFTGAPDVVHASGALQYSPDFRKALAELIACEGRYLVLPRLGLSETNADVVSVHEAKLSDNGPGRMPEGLSEGTTRYPFTFPAREAIEGLIAERYEFLIRATDSSGVFPVNDSELTGRGYVGRLRLG